MARRLHGLDVQRMFGDKTDWTDYGELVARYIYLAVLGVFALLFIRRVYRGQRCCRAPFFPKGKRASSHNQLLIITMDSQPIDTNAQPSDTNDILISVSDAEELRPRSWTICIFADWAAYEDFHSLCWILVDLSWNYFLPFCWWPVFVLTFAIALDVTFLSFRVPNGIVDSAHYIFQIVWMSSSFIWVLGDFYIGASLPSKIFSLFSPSENAAFDYRFWSSVVCAFSLLLGVAFHAYWAYCSWMLSKKMRF
jgi:hypothetical protein